MKDYFEYAWKELSRRKGRTIISILGYTIAIGVMVLFVSVLQFSKSAQNEVLSSVGTHFVVFSPYTVSSRMGTDELENTNGQCCPLSLYPLFKNALSEDLSKNALFEDEGFYVGSIRTKVFPPSFIDLAKGISSIRAVSQYLMFRFKDAKDKHLYTVGGLMLEDNVAIKNNSCSSSNLTQGRFLEVNDENKVILEEAYSKARNISVGDSIIVGDFNYTVIGIVSTSIRPAKADVYMTFNEAQRVISTRLSKPLIENEFNLLLVEAESALVQDDAINSLKNIISGYSAISTFNCYKPAAEVMGMNESSVLLLIIIVVIVTLAFSLKTQFSSVVERRHDIGILKIIGWTNRNIVFQIIIESLLQAIIGAIIGCILAWFAIALIPINQLFGMDLPVNVTIPWNISLFCILIALVAGVVGGSLPAIVAARQKPSDILRDI